MTETNSNELEAQLRALAQAHKPDGAFAEQLAQRLMAAHVVTKPSLWSRVSSMLKRLGLTGAPSEDNLPQYDARELKPKPNWSLASAVLLAVLVLAGGLIFALSEFPDPLSHTSSIASAPTARATPTTQKRATPKQTIMPTQSIVQTKSVAIQNLPPKPIPVAIVMFTPVPTKLVPVIKLNDFHLSTTEAAPGEHVTATWSFDGTASKVAILVPQPGETGEYLFSSSPVTRQTASLVFTVPALWGQTQDVQLSVNDAVIASVQLTQRLAKCKDAWFFTPLPSGCPAGPITQTFAAVQVFEGGRMFWFQHSKTIAVLYEANGFSSGMQTFADNYTEGTPEADPSLIAPTGKQQPRRGFGWVWRTSPEVRQRLGWALQPEQGFNTCAQNAPPLAYFIDNTGYLIRLVGLEGSGYYQWDKVAPREGAFVNAQCSP